MKSLAEIQNRVERLQAQQFRLQRRISRKKLQAAVLHVLVLTSVGGILALVAVRASPWGTPAAGWGTLAVFLYFIVGLNLAVILSRKFKVNAPFGLRWTNNMTGMGYYRGKDSPRHRMERRYGKNGRTLDALFVACELLGRSDGCEKLAALVAKQKLEIEKREKLQFQTEGQKDTTYLKALQWCAGEGGNE